MCFHLHMINLLIVCLIIIILIIQVLGYQIVVTLSELSSPISLLPIPLKRMDKQLSYQRALLFDDECNKRMRSCLDIQLTRPGIFQ